MALALAEWLSWHMPDTELFISTPLNSFIQTSESTHDFAISICPLTWTFSQFNLSFSYINLAAVFFSSLFYYYGCLARIRCATSSSINGFRFVLTKLNDWIAIRFVSFSLFFIIVASLFIVFNKSRHNNWCLKLFPIQWTIEIFVPKVLHSSRKVLKATFFIHSSSGMQSTLLSSRRISIQWKRTRAMMTKTFSFRFVCICLPSVSPNLFPTSVREIRVKSVPKSWEQREKWTTKK